MAFGRGLQVGFVVALVATAFNPAAAAELSGKSLTKGGSKPFCKGSTTIAASVSGDRIVIETPLAAGGPAKVQGRIGKDGAFKASGSRFTFSGKASAKGASGTWKGPSCFGTFSLRA